MRGKLWYMNADFEMELATGESPYKRPVSFEAINHRLAPRLLWLADPGDYLLLDRTPDSSVVEFSEQHGVTLVVRGDPPPSGLAFSPWGWTPGMQRLAQEYQCVIEHPDLSVVRTVNSKLWSYDLENELDVQLAGSAVAATMEDMEVLVRTVAPNPEDKWVIKSPYGFAARDRVLGRGPQMQHAQRKWVERRFKNNTQLLFQPWLDVEREYGVTIVIRRDGTHEFVGVSDLKTNGAGTGQGYYFGRGIRPDRLARLKEVAEVVTQRLWNAGYFGPAGIDALEHTGGLLPILEINARYTMGFVALAVESSGQMLEDRGQWLVKERLGQASNKSRDLQ